MQIVTELFRRLENQRIAYAVLRNYETLPELRGGDLTRNTDIDLVVASKDVPRTRKLLASVGADSGWDVLTECEHFQKSPARHHNIEIFQFFRFEPIEFLQVDVFHGYVNWGLPLMDEKELLRGRIQDLSRGITHIDPVKENIFRLAQIHGLGRSTRTAKKRARYRAKIVALCETREREFLKLVRRVLGPFGVRATEAIREGDEDAFSRAVPLAKAWFLGRYALRHPVSTAWQIAERYRENQTRFHREPCGVLLPVYTASDRARASFEQAMDTLAELNILDEWAHESDGECRERRAQMLEQGAIIVRWTDRASASVVVESDDDPDEISRSVLRQTICRHRVLYSSQNLRQKERHGAAVEA